MTPPLVWVLVGAALVAMALALVRLVLGPCQADRVVALDVLFSAMLTLTAAAALLTGRSLFLDVGIGLAMVGFVATIVWSRLIDASAPGEASPAPGEASPASGEAASGETSPGEASPRDGGGSR